MSARGIFAEFADARDRRAREEESYRRAVVRFGERLRSAREARGWTLAQVGARIGCTGQLVWLIETGKNRPSVATLGKLIDLFDGSHR